MSARKTLRARKTVVKLGAWAEGRMPPNAFPMSYGRKFRLALGWKWCVHTLTDGIRTFNLLVAFDPGKQQYQSWLGVVKGNDNQLVGRLEFHDSHGGWHCHWKACSLSDVRAGVVKTGSFDRTRQCKGERLDISELDATGIAFRIFNVDNGLAGSRELML